MVTWSNVSLRTRAVRSPAILPPITTAFVLFVFMVASLFDMIVLQSGRYVKLTLRDFPADLPEPESQWLFYDS
jgi:hypothetical protein